MFNENIMKTKIIYETPTKTGRKFKIGNVWKDEYIYYKNIGALPNTGTIVLVETSLPQSSVTLITGCGGMATNGTNYLVFNACRPLDASGAISCITNWQNSKFTFQVECGRDRSAFTGHCWVTYC